MIVHFDGETFRLEHRTGDGTFRLRSLWAGSATDVWAVGDAGIVRWDGATWSQLCEPPVL